MLTKPPILDETGQKILSGIARIKNALLGTTSDPVTPGSAGSSGTEPVFQDDTGRDIITALNDLGTAVKPASATDNGYVSTGSQTIAGEKTFTSPVILKTTGSTSAGAAELDYLYGNNTNGIRVFAGRTYSSGKVHTTRLKIQQYSYDSTSKENISTSQMYNLPEVPADLAADEDYNIITTNNLTDIPDASASVRGMVSTGTQTFKGSKSFTNIPTVDSATSAGSGLILCFSDKSDAQYAGLYELYNSGSPYIALRQYSVDANGDRVGKFEGYCLPEATLNLASNTNYDILTSKSPVTIEQGGTGATTLEGVREALQFLRMYTFSLASGTAKAFTVPNNSRHFVVVGGTAAGRSGAFIVAATSTGSMGVLEVAKGASLAYTTATNTLTLTASGGAATVMVISMYGSSITG